MKNQHLVLFIMLGFAISFGSCDPKPSGENEEQKENKETPGAGDLTQTLKVAILVKNYQNVFLNSAIKDLSGETYSVQEITTGVYILSTESQNPQIQITSATYETTVFSMTGPNYIPLIEVNLTEANDSNVSFEKDIAVNFVNDVDVTFDFDQAKSGENGTLTLPIISSKNVQVSVQGNAGATWVQTGYSGILTTTSSNPKLEIEKDEFQPLGINLNSQNYVSSIIAPLQASNGDSVTVSFKVKSKKKTKVKVVMDDAHGPGILEDAKKED